MKQKNNSSITEHLPVKLKLQSSLIQRRTFVKGLAAIGLLTQTSFLSAFNINANPISNPYKTNPDLLSSKQLNNLRDIQQYLFPNDGNGPGATQVNATEYLIWVLSDPQKDPADTKYIIDGIDWVAETADEEYAKPFEQLNTAEKEALVGFIANEAWGSSWLSIILTYIFEAMIADPQYGGNTNEDGWKWLNHYPGNPRPTEELLYGNILNQVKRK